MLKHTLTARGLLVASMWLSAVACGDDAAASNTPDAGQPCSTGAIGPCYCDTGTSGVRYCQASTTTWGMCLCNELEPLPQCNPGDLVDCLCPDRTPSKRMCRASNTLDPCMCEGHMPIDASTELDSGNVDGSVLDSGNDDAG